MMCGHSGSRWYLINAFWCCLQSEMNFEKQVFPTSTLHNFIIILQEFQKYIESIPQVRRDGHKFSGYISKIEEKIPQVFFELKNREESYDRMINSLKAENRDISKQNLMLSTKYKAVEGAEVEKLKSELMDVHNKLHESNTKLEGERTMIESFMTDVARKHEKTLSRGKSSSGLWENARKAIWFQRI